MKLDYTVQVDTAEGLRELSGSAELEGVLRLAPELPEGTIRSAEARLSLYCSDWERIFMNGFQSWSCSPEYTRRDRIRSLRHLPKAGVRYFGLDRYGDDYFVPYPDRPGVTHGESWCYFRDGERFRLLASLDERPGYTLFTYDAAAGLLTIRRDCEGLRCGGAYPVFELYYAEGGEDAVFDGWFAAMGVTARTQEKIAGYSSWYNRYQAISEETILSDLLGCAEVLRPGDLFQIDDGWEPFVGDWLETDAKKFPNGLKPIAGEIHARGLKAGLWLAPFVAQKGSALLREHPDWFYLHDGKPWYCGVNWGGFYALDIDKPEVLAYLREVFRQVFEDWGFDLVKLDFLYSAAPFGSETESRAARMCRAMNILRKACRGKQILGCGVPLWPAFGIVEYCRVGCDVGLDWNGSKLMQITHRERVSTKQSIEDTTFRRELTGRAFMGDPDVFFLREGNCVLTPEEKEKLYTANALLGGMLLTSDALNQYDDAKKAQFAHVRDLLENAADVTVDADDGLVLSWTLNGEAKTLRIL